MMSKSMMQSDVEQYRDNPISEKDGSANDMADMIRMGKQQTLRVRQLWENLSSNADPSQYSATSAFFPSLDSPSFS